jgi:outer membrane beta-barrel protein
MNIFSWRPWRRASSVAAGLAIATATTVVANEPEPGSPPAAASSSKEKSSTVSDADVERALKSKKVRLTTQHAVIRTGPGESFAIVGVFPDGETFRVLAKRGEWYNVQVSVSETGWVHSSLCKEFDDLSDLEFRPNPRLYSRVGSFAFTGYGGAYAFDRKSNSLVLGGRLSYYVFDFIQIEGGVAWSHITRPREIVESLFDLTLEAEDFHMLFYNMNVTVEVLPGRQMVPFVTGGVGSQIMQGKTEPGFNYGGGTQLFLSKRTAMRWEVRNFRFDSGSQGARRTNNNVEFTLGTALLF